MNVDDPEYSRSGSFELELRGLGSTLRNKDHIQLPTDDEIVPYDSITRPLNQTEKDQRSQLRSHSQSLNQNNQNDINNLRQLGFRCGPRVYSITCFVLFMIFLFFLFFLIGYFAGKSSSNDSSTSNSKNHKLLIISLDGFRHMYLDPSLTPNLVNLGRGSNGVMATRGMRPVFPSITFPNHYSLATGLYPESHGIINNNFYDAALNRSFGLFNSDSIDSVWWLGEPIWVSLNKFSKASRGSCVVFWPGSESIIQSITPTKFLKYNSAFTNQMRVDLSLEWLSSDECDLVMVYFSSVDSAGHNYGPNNINKTIKAIDTVVGSILSGLESKNFLSSTNILIGSDHGMTSTPKNLLINLETILPDIKNYITSAVQSNDRFLTGSIAFIYTDNIDQENYIYNHLINQNNFKIWHKDSIPFDWHFSGSERIPSLVLLADEGYSFVVNSSLSWWNEAGNHGYDPSLNSMQAIFFGSGPSFQHLAWGDSSIAYELDSVRTIDFYALACFLLQIPTAPNNGTLDIIRPFLRSN